MKIGEVETLAHEFAGLIDCSRLRAAIRRVTARVSCRRWFVICPRGHKVTLAAAMSFEQSFIDSERKAHFLRCPHCEHLVEMSP
jgi:phage terminase large subunit GpA-like protein